MWQFVAFVGQNLSLFWPEDGIWAIFQTKNELHREKRIWLMEVRGGRHNIQNTCTRSHLNSSDKTKHSFVCSKESEPTILRGKQGWKIVSCRYSAPGCFGNKLTDMRNAADKWVQVTYSNRSHTRCLVCATC